MPSSRLITQKLFCTAVIFFSVVALAEIPQLVAPPYNSSNRHDVNMLTAQIQMTHKDVNIGGAMGLSHSISMHTSSWVGADTAPIGPVDQYEGRLFSVERRDYPQDLRRWIVASDGTTTQYFDPGEHPTTAVPNASGYFPSNKDKRYTLRLESGLGMVMTKPDGTKVIFGASTSYNMTSSYNMAEIRSPNGFTIKINLKTDREPGSVTTNTGYQLRYYYVPNNNPLDPSLASLNRDKGIESTGWWGLNPRYVVGINNAVQNCPNEAGSQLNDSGCSTTKWPKAEYLWPDGMPRRMYLADGTFSVINPDGTQTDYNHSPVGKCGAYLVCPNEQYFLPRLSSVKPASANQVTTQYRYINTATSTIWGIAGFYTPKDYGILSQSWNGSDAIGYDLNKLRTDGGAVSGIYQSSSGYQTITETSVTPGGGPNGGRPVRIDAWNYQAVFNNDGLLKSYANFLKQIGEAYDYDLRGNLTSVVSQGGTRLAEYESSCTSVNEKYCNSPKWIRDARLNKTYYTYHPESGQVQTITYPANKKGVVAVTRYKYEQKTATYYNGLGAKITGTPIWLLVSEKTCANTATTGDACAGGSADEIVKTHEYNNDNLLLSGVAVTAANATGSVITQRTCYQYDIYGNQIGITQPAANKASCEARY